MAIYSNYQEFNPTTHFYMSLCDQLFKPVERTNFLAGISCTKYVQSFFEEMHNAVALEEMSLEKGAKLVGIEMGFIATTLVVGPVETTVHIAAAALIALVATLMKLVCDDNDVAALYNYIKEYFPAEDLTGLIQEQQEKFVDALNGTLGLTDEMKQIIFEKGLEKMNEFKNCTPTKEMAVNFLYELAAISIASPALYTAQAFVSSYSHVAYSDQVIDYQGQARCHIFRKEPG